MSQEEISAQIVNEIIDYLNTMPGKPYHNPDPIEDPEKKQEFIDARESGRNLKKLTEKIANQIKPNDFTIDSGSNKYLDGSNQKMRDYFWIQCKLQQYYNSPVSISIFFELYNQKPQLRISLEIKNNDATQEQKRCYQDVILNYQKPDDILYFITPKDATNNGEISNDAPEKLSERCQLKSNSPDYIDHVQLAKIWTLVKDKSLSLIELQKAFAELEIPYKEIMKEISFQDQTTKVNKQDIDISLNTILFGPPGTGKTYNSVNYATAICQHTSLDMEKNRPYSDVFKDYQEFKNAGQIQFITFHQSYSYEDFIEGIKPGLTNDGNLTYQLSDGIFKQFCKKAHDNANENFVLIIDEINRGNISKIFGELITLIETTKRQGANEEASAILPYSHENFSIPQNVYILGTMNTADRSIAVLDTALRRRFKFIEMMPDSSLLDSIKINDQINVSAMLQAINDRIEILIDREHTIGHAYFMKLNDPQQASLDNLKDIMLNQVLPLLQDYFFDDYDKIRMVLNDNNFVQAKPINEALFIDNELNLPEVRYVINETAFNEISNYQKIYQNESDNY